MQRRYGRRLEKKDEVSYNKTITTGEGEPL